MSSWAGWLLCVVGFTPVPLDPYWCGTEQTQCGIWLSVDRTSPGWGSEQGANSGTGQSRPWGAEWLAAGRGLCSAVLGREGVLSCPALSPLWLGKSVGFGMGSPIPDGGQEPLTPPGKGCRGRHGEGVVLGRAGCPQQVVWAGLGACHQHSHPGSMPKSGRAAPCARLRESPGPPARALNVLTALSDRTGVTSSWR